MNTPITITTQIIGTEETNAVNAREVHKALEIKKDFSSWVKAQIESLGLEENVDFVSLTQKGEREIGATIRIEYILTLDAAKHIAMASRSAKGKEVRAYFIEAEKRYRIGVANVTQQPIMEAVLESLHNIGQVVSALGMQMERLDRRLQIYEEKEIYRREKARLRASRNGGSYLIGSAYESRRKQFIALIQSILRETEASLNQSQLLIAAGYRKDDKTARKWLGEGIGIYWRVEPIRNQLIYTLLQIDAA